MASPSISDQAVRQQTGHGWEHWFQIMDRFEEPDHAARVRRLAAREPSLTGWWQQAVVVEWEKARGHRVEGQSCQGDFQVSCSKTLPGDAHQAWVRLLDHGILPEADWSKGATWKAQEAEIEVRRVDPGKMLRWFWRDADGRSTVEASFVPKGAKTAVVFRHHGLASQEARERARVRWKAVLDQVASADA